MSDAILLVQCAHGLDSIKGRASSVCVESGKLVAWKMTKLKEAGLSVDSANRLLNCHFQYAVGQVIFVRRHRLWNRDSDRNNA